jgi:hypothetical protein
MKIVYHTMLAILAVSVFSGCMTTEDDEDDFLIPKQTQKKYLSHTVPPQQYNFEVYPTTDGIAYRGACRVHPRHMANAKFLEDDIPAIKMTGSAARDSLKVLIDVSSPSSWIEFKSAQKMGIKYMGWNDQVFPYLGVYNTGGADAYAGIITQLRIKQLFIEDAPFYVRMATGSLGPLARGIEVPELDAIFGWDNIHQFEYVQFDLQERSVYFSASMPYAPHEECVITKAKMVKLRNYGLAVEGAIFGEKTPILLDFAGNYHFARGDKRVTTTKQVSIGELVYRKVPTLMLPVHNSPPRVGRKMLAPYVVTICNSTGDVYFELKPENLRKAQEKAAVAQQERADKEVGVPTN